MKRTALASGLLLLLVAVAWPQQAGVQKEGDARLKGLEALVTRIMSAWNIPGCSLAIVEKDSVLFCGGFGSRELRFKKPVDARTLFPIYSCTKAFTAALIGILAEEGKIDIDRPAYEYLPILRFSDPLLTLQVTPRDMLTHRTGIPGHGNSWYGSENAPRDGLVRLIQYFADRIIRHLELTFVAEKPPPAPAFEQVALMAAEENGEYE
jgi:CubicO group peptidase (beta-lactamase class C family)